MNTAPPQVKFSLSRSLIYIILCCQTAHMASLISPVCLEPEPVLMGRIFGGQSQASKSPVFWVCSTGKDSPLALITQGTTVNNHTAGTCCTGNAGVLEGAPSRLQPAKYLHYYPPAFSRQALRGQSTSQFLEKISSVWCSWKPERSSGILAPGMHMGSFSEDVAGLWVSWMTGWGGDPARLCSCSVTSTITRCGPRCHM